MILGHAPIIVQNMLGERPEPFDPVDMVLGSTIHEPLTVIDRVMFAVAPQRLIATKGIRVIDGPFAGGGLNMRHAGVRRHVLDDLGIDPSIPLQQPKHDTFASGPPAPPPLTSPAEIRFIQLNLTREFTGRLLTKPASCVLAALRGSTYGGEYASPLRWLRHCWTAFLNSLRGILPKSAVGRDGLDLGSPDSLSTH